MAATITTTTTGGDKQTIFRKVIRVIGSGAPANGDLLCTQVAKYPLGTEYLDTTNSKIWWRTGTAGTAADFKGVAIA